MNEMKLTPEYPIGGYAPGNYSCKCVTCNKVFNGDKRAVQCEPCATSPQPMKLTPEEKGMKVAIIGEGDESIRVALAKKLGHDDIIVITNEEAKEMKMNQLEAIAEQVFPYKNYHVPFAPSGKQFVCKGRHQYRKEGPLWKCQCGRVLNMPEEYQPSKTQP